MKLSNSVSKEIVKKERWTATKIKALRESLALTQKDFGQKIGTSGNYVWMMEASQRKPSETLGLLLDCLEGTRR